MKKILIALAVTVVCAVVVQAGWERTSGRTTWVSRPTPATCWTRDSAGVLYPVQKIQIFEDTIRHFSSEAYDSGTTNYPVNLGFWLVDATTSAIYPNPELGAVNCTINLTPQGNWTDVEWDIDENGILVPKE